MQCRTRRDGLEGDGYLEQEQSLDGRGYRLRAIVTGGVFLLLICLVLNPAKRLKIYIQLKCKIKNLFWKNETQRTLKVIGIIYIL